ncbi:FUSC family protein [Acetobacter conturbans]|nr:FUSC family protein [Acetobacter conturbans]
MKTSPILFRRRISRFFSQLPSGMMPAAITHWLGARAINIAPEQIAVREGLRAGVAVGTVMLLAWHLQAPIMAWAAFSAFWTCLVDPGGLIRLRLQTLMKFALSGTMITGLMAAASGLGIIPVFIALGVCIFICGLTRMRGPIATQISVLAAIVAVVAVCYPQSPEGAVHLAGMFVSGSIWAVLICVFAWPVDPYAPQKQACAAIFREQANMAGRLLNLNGAAPLDDEKLYHEISAYRRDIRRRIEQTRSMVETLSAGILTHRAHATLFPAVEAADRIFVAVMGFEHAAFSAPLTPVAHRTIELVSATLRHLAWELSRPQPRPESLKRQIEFLRTAGPQQGDLFARGAHLCADALTDLQAAWRKAPDQQTVWKNQATARRQPPAKALFVRHAARLSVAVLTAYAISLWLVLPYAYWAMMAVVVVIQPSVNVTLPRALERMAGSIAGGLLAALMGVALPMSAILLLIFPLAALTIALRSVNYTLCVMFMTQLFVLVTDLVSSTHGWDVALSRAENNIIGSLVGLAACLLLWPEKKAPPLPALITAAFDANIRYAALAARTDKATWSAIEQARRDAGTASTKAEILYQQTRLEGLRRSDYLKICGEILLLLRQLAGAANVWWLEHTDTASPLAAERAARYATFLQEPEMTSATGKSHDTKNLLGMQALLKSLSAETA